MHMNLTKGARSTFIIVFSLMSFFLFSHSADATTFCNISFVGSSGHTFTADQCMTADTDQSSYYPGQTVWVTGTSPTTASCSNGNTNNGGIYIVSINGGPKCAYASAYLCAVSGDTRNCQDYQVCQSSDITSAEQTLQSQYPGSTVVEESITYAPKFPYFSQKLTAPVVSGTYYVPITLGFHRSGDSTVYSNWTGQLPYTVIAAQCTMPTLSTTWTDPNLASGTSVKAIHIQELRVPVDTFWHNAYPSAPPLDYATFETNADQSVATGQPIYAGQVKSIGDALDAIAQSCSTSTYPWIDVPTVHAPIYAKYVQELRQVIELYNGQNLTPPPTSSAGGGSGGGSGGGGGGGGRPPGRL